MASKIVLVLGAGSNVGANVASYFSKKTYKVAVVSRNPSREVFKTADLLIPADLTDLSTIPSIFAEVRSKLGVPNVVVYNGTYPLFLYTSHASFPQILYIYIYFVIFLFIFLWNFLTRKIGASSNLNGPDPFSIPVDKWAAGVNITTINAYSAVQQAIAGFKELPRDARKTFIYTGNACTHAVLPTIMNLGVGKNAVAHMVKCAVKVHEQDGFR